MRVGGGGVLGGATDNFFFLMAGVSMPSGPFFLTVGDPIPNNPFFLMAGARLGKGGVLQIKLHPRWRGRPSPARCGQRGGAPPPMRPRWREARHKVKVDA
jgi:hypothetical protein